MAAPVNTVAPAITGTVSVSSALSVSNGTWTGTPTSYAYAWLRDGSAISGATAATYTLLMADIATAIIGRVTATNADGSTIADSAATVAVPTTLIVETGAQVVSANAYRSRANLDVYHVALGNTTWAALSIANKETAARRATEYMQEMYRYRWKGYRVAATQALDWPRANVYLDDGPWGWFLTDDSVPAEVVDVWSKFALRAASADLAADLTRAKTSVTIGPISTSYDTSSPEYTRYRALEASLSPYFKGSSNVAEIVRS